MIKISDLSLKKKIPEISRLDIVIPEGETYVLLSSGDTVFNHLINIFSGMETDFKGSVEIDDNDIRGDWDYCKTNMVHLTNGKEWPPDMKVASIISFFKNNMVVYEEEYEELYVRLNLERISRKRINEIEEMEWRRILFSLARLRKSKNYIFRDFAMGMPLDFNLELKKNINEIKNNGCSILYLSNDVFFAPEIGDRIGFMKKGKLLLELKASRMRKMSLQELYFQFLAEK